MKTLLAILILATASISTVVQAAEVKINPATGAPYKMRYGFVAVEEIPASPDKYPDMTAKGIKYNIGGQVKTYDELTRNEKTALMIVGAEVSKRDNKVFSLFD